MTEKLVIHWKLFRKAMRLKPEKQIFGKG